MSAPDDGFNPAGCGPSPILPRDVVELIRVADDALDRADEILAGLKAPIADGVGAS